MTAAIHHTILILYVWLYISICVYIHVCMNSYMHIYVCIGVFIHVCMCVRVYAYTPFTIGGENVKEFHKHNQNRALIHPGVCTYIRIWSISTYMLICNEWYAVMQDEMFKNLLDQKAAAAAAACEELQHLLTTSQQHAASLQAQVVFSCISVCMCMYVYTHEHVTACSLSSRTVFIFMYLRVYISVCFCTWIHTCVFIHAHDV